MLTEKPIDVDRGERADQRDRDGQRRDQRRPPVAQEEPDDRDDDDDGERERAHHLVDRAVDEGGVVAGDEELTPVGSVGWSSATTARTPRGDRRGCCSAPGG